MADPSHVEDDSTGQAVVDLAQGRSQVTMTADSDQTGSPAGAPSGQTEQISIGADTWVRGSIPANILTNGKPWTHLHNPSGAFPQPERSLSLAVWWPRSNRVARRAEGSRAPGCVWSATRPSGALPRVITP